METSGLLAAAFCGCSCVYFNYSKSQLFSAATVAALAAVGQSLII